MIPRALRTDALLRSELAVIGLVYGAFGAVIAFAPAKIIVTPGSMPVFTILPCVFTVTEARTAWAIAYALCGALAVALSVSMRSVTLMHITWPAVGFTNFIWALVFIMAAFNGQGSALGAVIFLVPLLWAGFTGIRVAQKTGDPSVDARSGGPAGNTR